MTEHDAIRRDRALACDRNSLKSLSEAIVGLQSTDDPSLNALHDELMARYTILRESAMSGVSAFQWDGGLAFPQLSILAPSGMSLRDYFAAQAMQGMIAANLLAVVQSDVRLQRMFGLVVDDKPGQEVVFKPSECPSKLASSAYLMADAMLAAREKQDGA